MTAQYDNQPTGQQSHGAPHSAPAGNVLSIIAMVLGALAILILPIVLGPIGLVLGIIAKTVRHERLAVPAIVVAAVGMIAGFVLGALLA
ncbi:hypothetical protein [Streptomyces sp. cmx-18-6]|uniref:hypothetical protein n=1 Tax=Streptomyces sp. cmx-18-6 TaxID=2790930 RepID=UPI00397FDFB9